jgi:hypothetical protein
MEAQKLDVVTNIQIDPHTHTYTRERESSSRERKRIEPSAELVVPI